MRYVLDGLAVERVGTGMPFVWGHGLTSSRAHEDELGLFDMPAAAAGCELTRYDARGHGESAGVADPSAYTWLQLSHDMAMIVETGREPSVVGGASMGAATALHLACRRPDLVSALVLVIPPTAWETRAAQAELYEGAATFVEQRGKAAYIEASRRLPLVSIFAELGDEARFDPDISEALIPSVLRGAGASDFPPPSEVATIGVPSLILSWEGDPGHPVSTGQRLNALITDSQFHTAATVAKVREWRHVIATFLSRSSSSPS